MPAEPVDADPPDPPRPAIPPGSSRPDESQHRGDPAEPPRESAGPLALPGQIRAAAIVVLLQAAGLLVAVVVLLVKIAQGGYQDAVRAWADAGFALLGALALVFAARALSFLHPAARTPLLVVEVLALPVGYSMILSGAWQYGGPVVLGALVVIVLLLTRPARTALDRR